MIHLALLIVATVIVGWAVLAIVLGAWTGLAFVWRSPVIRILIGATVWAAMFVLLVALLSGCTTTTVMRVGRLGLYIRPAPERAVLAGPLTDEPAHTRRKR
jgi:hypothetical protein